MHPLSICLLVVVAAVAALAAPPNKYSDKFDNLDVDMILKNDRVLTSYINCVLDKGPCTAEGREFRKNLPDALQTSCEKCTPNQKKMIRKASKHIIANRKEDWEQIRKKFDPKGTSSDRFRKFLAADN